jgi:hypothetical protein
VRGNAAHIVEKYVQLARDAQNASDSVAEQNYLQHAEHYLRIVSSAQAQNQLRQERQLAENQERQLATSKEIEKNEAAEKPDKEAAQQNQENDVKDTPEQKSEATQKTRVRRPRRQPHVQENAQVETKAVETKGDNGDVAEKTTSESQVSELPSFVTEGVKPDAAE